MSFQTNWEPDKAVGEIEKIAKKQGHNMYNINQKVGEPVSDGRGGWKVRAESVRGFRHDTGGEYHIKQHPIKGSIISYVPDWKTGSSEAQNVEDSTKNYYFNDDY